MRLAWSTSVPSLGGAITRHFRRHNHVLSPKASGPQVREVIFLPALPATSASGGSIPSSEPPPSKSMLAPAPPLTKFSTSRAVKSAAVDPAAADPAAVTEVCQTSRAHRESPLHPQVTRYPPATGGIPPPRRPAYNPPPPPATSPYSRPHQRQPISAT
jgi:hypothetical protein